MSWFLGVDTSNYTTSVACYNAEKSIICHSKLLLPVEPGQLGLRQSDALFWHLRRLPQVMDEVMKSPEAPGDFVAVAASSQPRAREDSYMPCFLAGTTVAEGIALAEGVPCYKVSHQEGHLAAAIWSAGRMDLADKLFLAFHVSGGTMEVLCVTPDPVRIFAVEILGGTLDISAGQLIDRVGVSLGMNFPAGPALEALAATGTTDKKRVIPLKNGCCNLSGMENIIGKMLEDGTPPPDAARYLLNTLADLLCRMTQYARKQAGQLPVVYSGGVMSNRYICESLSRLPGQAIFAKPEFSADNAAGVAILAAFINSNH